jgi:hypothetical protein
LAGFEPASSVTEADVISAAPRHQGRRHLILWTILKLPTVKNSMDIFEPGGVVYILVIVTANGTEDRGFKSRQGEMLIGFNTLQCYFLNT